MSTAICAVITWAGMTLIPAIPSAPLRGVAWVAYWIAQGTAGTGLWVLGHEAGHGAFSPSKTINDIVGFVVHSALLVPYFSWKFSHAQHHAATHDLDRDQVFVPHAATDKKDVEENSALAEALDESPLGSLIGILLMWTVGWPGYLLFNFSGQSYNGTRANHFEPQSPIFKDSQRSMVVLSDLGLVAMGLFLARWVKVAGWWSMVAHYLIPYLGVNFWLVTLTFLHHSDTRLPFYRGSDWNFVKGALATVDRDYGTLLNFLHHHIGDTHVAHHLFSTMPHYHALEATAALKAKLGPYYVAKKGNPLTDLYPTWRNCRIVQKVDHDVAGTVFVYKSKVE
jgi:omega-6 fatty acid desaturase (delta-12 desaturase)